MYMCMHAHSPRCMLIGHICKLPVCTYVRMQWHTHSITLHTYIPLRAVDDICLLRCLLWSCQWHRKRAPFSASEGREEGTSCDTGQPAGEYHKDSAVRLTWHTCPSLVSFPFRDEFSDWRLTSSFCIRRYTHTYTHTRTNIMMIGKFVKWYVLHIRTYVYYCMYTSTYQHVIACTHACTHKTCRHVRRYVPSAVSVPRSFSPDGGVAP